MKAQLGTWDRHAADQMSTRYYYLDAARGILMILGIVYHAARVYGEPGWVISDSSNSPAFDRLALLLTSFRMPAFFLMSGFFAAQTLKRYGAGPFLWKRVPRVLIPFVTALFTLNIAQLYALNVYAGGSPAGLAYLVSPALWGDFSSDRWISHLWFLMCLAYYFGAIAMVAVVLRGGDRGQALVARVGDLTTLVGHPVVCLLLVPVVNVAILGAFSLFPILYALRPIVSLEDVARYIPYFTAGLLAFANRRFYESMTRFNWGVVGLTAAVVLALVAGPEPGGALAARILDAYLGFLGAWVGIYWVLVFFKTILDRPSRVASTLADSAYSIYLFHHLTVILIAWWLLSVDWSAFVKFAVVVSATFAVTISLHLVVIRNVPLLSLLFNGKPRAATSTEISRAES